MSEHDTSHPDDSRLPLGLDLPEMDGEAVMKRVLARRNRERQREQELIERLRAYFDKLDRQGADEFSLPAAAFDGAAFMERALARREQERHDEQGMIARLQACVNLPDIDADPLREHVDEEFLDQCSDEELAAAVDDVDDELVELCSDERFRKHHPSESAASPTPVTQQSIKLTKGEADNLSFDADCAEPAAKSAFQDLVSEFYLRADLFEDADLFQSCLPARSYIANGSTDLLREIESASTEEDAESLARAFEFGIFEKYVCYCEETSHSKVVHGAAYEWIGRVLEALQQYWLARFGFRFRPPYFLLLQVEADRNKTETADVLGDMNLDVNSARALGRITNLAEGSE